MFTQPQRVTPYLHDSVLLQAKGLKQQPVQQRGAVREAHAGAQRREGLDGSERDEARGDI